MLVLFLSLKLSIGAEFARAKQECDVKLMEFNEARESAISLPYLVLIASGSSLNIFNWSVFLVSADYLLCRYEINYHIKYILDKHLPSKGYIIIIMVSSWLYVCIWKD